MKRDINTVNDWDFERIIMCHGVRFVYLVVLWLIHIVLQDVIEKDGKAAWKEAYGVRAWRIYGMGFLHREG
jgi:hypothetical protein